MDEDLIVLGAPAETQAAGSETSENAASQVDSHPAGGEGEAAAPGTGSAEVVAPEAPEGGKPEGSPEEPKPRPKRTGIERMRDRIARLEAENANLRSAPSGAGEDRKAALEKEIGAAPKEADFADFMEFEDAKADYRVRKALAEQRLADREVQTSRTQYAARQEAVEAFQERMDEARDRIPDFDRVLNEAKGREVAPHLTDLIVESEKGALLAYYLAKNPAELQRLNGMGERQAAKAVGALEHRLTLAKPKTATKAPAPARPVSGGAAPSSPDAEGDAWLAKTYGRRG
ncbi:hypothetical protein Maq22A_c02485 [Methylobacterium aquaticum]|uniref:Uncharacterized protein n=2 Tax=Methylobacterium aquaticum TaxID=270351 RepID=A0A0C6FG02_9HYPH|nr:hypothetical protein Maq22A_c02485 [Methylobacterium aquaticum]